jgi:hypothetical protein
MIKDQTVFDLPTFLYKRLEWKDQSQIQGEKRTKSKDRAHKSLITIVISQESNPSHKQGKRKEQI